MRTADHGLRPPASRAGREVERAVQLMALDADERHESPLAHARLEAGEIFRVGFDVLVDRLDIARQAADDTGSHTREIRKRAVWHETAAEALDETVGRVLTGLDDDDAERGHGRASRTGV